MFHKVELLGDGSSVPGGGGDNNAVVADLGIDGIENAVEIGRGGFAAVYMADQPRFRRKVAVKVLFADALDDQSRRRFERECESMGTLSSHPAIVTLYDAGFTSDDRPYLVMMFLEGGSLADRLDRAGRIEWNEVRDIGVRLAEALDAAHRSGIIHRDVKPDNVLVSEFGNVELSDFGIARITGATQTATGVISATVVHAAPEVLEGEPPTAASDIYSLGSTLYELMSGTPAFVRTTDQSITPLLRRILLDDLPDLRPAGVPDAMASTIERMMARAPADRYSNGAEVAGALRGLAVVPAAADATEHTSHTCHPNGRRAGPGADKRRGAASSSAWCDVGYPTSRSAQTRHCDRRCRRGSCRGRRRRRDHDTRHERSAGDRGCRAGIGLNRGRAAIVDTASYHHAGGSDHPATANHGCHCRHDVPAIVGANP